MTHSRIKFIVGGLVVSAAVAYLAAAGVSSGWVYHVEVDQFLADADYQDGRVRLTGLVGEDDLDSRPADLAAEFRLCGEVNRLPVAYRGVVPEMFKAGAEVIVEGRLDEAGVFQADVLMTKCASKYESEKPADHPAPTEDTDLIS